MRKTVVFVLGMSFFASFQLFTACNNNEEGKQHAKERRGSKVYLCSFKNKQFYGKDGSLYYDGDSCRNCSCPSAEHTAE